MTAVIPLTYGALWSFCDGERLNAEAQADGCERDLSSSPPPPAETADYLRKRLAAHRRREAHFIALAKLVERYERSAVIKDEIKKMADAERAARAAGDVVVIEAEGDSEAAE